MPKTAALVLLLVLALAPRASAQLVAAKEGPVVYGHHHVNATDVTAHKRFWVDTLGGTLTTVGTNKVEIVKMPNVLIFMRAQAAKGGTKGSVHDHLALSVPNLRAALEKVKNNGYQVITATDAPAGLEVKDDIAVVAGNGPVTGLAYALGPDDVKVELLEMKAQPEPVKLHHIHFFGPDREAMRAWYGKVFGATPAPGANPAFLTANLPGVGLNFTQTDGPVAPTTGRALDHIGFEVDGLEAFMKRLEGQGITPTVAYRQVPALGIAIAFITDPWGTNIELTEGLDQVP